MKSSARAQNLFSTFFILLTRKNDIASLVQGCRNLEKIGDFSPPTFGILLNPWTSLYVYGRNCCQIFFGDLSNAQWYNLLTGWVRQAMTWCDAIVVHGKRLLRVHTVSHIRDYCWKFVVCLQSSILHPKNTKFGKSDVFKSLKIA